jgi:hypothetical protein
MAQRRNEGSRERPPVNYRIDYNGPIVKTGCGMRDEWRQRRMRTGPAAGSSDGHGRRHTFGRRDERGRHAAAGAVPAPPVRPLTTDFPDLMQT